MIHLHSDSYEDLDKTIDALYAFTDCEVSISPNACVIVEDKPRFMSVNDILKYNTEQTVRLLRKELEIRKAELEEEWHFSSLIKIFIEKRIYRNIEECTTWESVIETIDLGLKPYKKRFKREITRDDIVALTEIKIKRISKYDVKEQDEKLRGLEDELKVVENHLANIKPYAINWYKELLRKYGKGRERKTEIGSFEQVIASEVIINNQKLYVNREDGFAGYGLKKDEFVTECSNLDDIIVFRGDGTMIVTKVDEKKYVGKDVRHIAILRKTEAEPVYNMIYQDGRGGAVMVKRFTVGGTTRDKDYILTKGSEGSKMLWLSFGTVEEAPVVRVMLRPKPKLRITQIDVNFGDYEVKGRSTNGNILTKNSASKVIKLSDAKPSPKAEQMKIDAVVKSNAPAPSAKKTAPPPPPAKKPFPVKSSGGSPAKKSQPLKEEAAVTVEWDMTANEKITNDRNRILNELEKKSKGKDNSQTELFEL
jgi:topoisomerase-4 subunit A